MSTHPTDSLPGESADAPWAPPALHQTSSPIDELIHSGNAGLIIHRVGQVHYEFREESREFARALQARLNMMLQNATTLLYEESLGVEDRLHWLVHLRNPNDYRRLLHQVDHDAELREIAESDRLPQKGGGNWERMFLQGSFRETVLAPQHGLELIVPERDRGHLGRVDPSDDAFVPPASSQTSLSADRLLNSATAGAILHRTGQIKYELREEGRAFAFEWQDYINRSLAGDATIYLYEEIWGTQDRIHWLIHLRSLDAFREIFRLGLNDPEYRAIFSRERIPAAKGGGTWGKMFLEGTLQDTLWIPHHEGMGSAWS